MKKTEVYSWRISSEVKSALEEEASAKGISIAQLLDGIVQAWLKDGSADGDEQALQQRLHAAAETVIGSIHGGDPHRAEQARSRIRGKLRRHHASSRVD